MAYNQQQQPQQQQQYVLTGQMVNIGGQQVLQQPQYVTVSQPEMAAAAVGKRFYMKNEYLLVLNL